MKTVGLILHPYDEQSSAGLGRSIYNLAREIVEQDKENTYLIFTKGEKSAPNFKGKNWKVVALPDKKFWLDRYLWAYRRQLDVCVFFTPIAPLFWKLRNMLVVVHDMGPWVLNAHSLRHRIIQCIQRVTLKRAEKIVAVSETTKKSITQFIPAVRDKIVVIYNGFDQLSAAGGETSIPDKPYFLFLGVLKKRKNPLGILRAFEIFKKQTGEKHLLVFAGSYDTQGEVALAIKESPCADDIIVRGHVSDAERASLYRHAYAFVFPSLFEGFGLPTLEAMSVGVPVITSQDRATEEVAGGAALLVDPKDPADIARAMQKFVEDETLRKQYIDAGLERVQAFSWERAGARYVECIHTVCGIMHRNGKRTGPNET